MTEAQLVHVPPASLKKSPTNPRKQLGDITSLIESVKTKGVLEPILARPNGGPDHLEIICGERRWTAATKAKLETVPVLVRELDDDEVLDVQLAENIERADLTPLEEAEAYAFRIQRKQSVAHIAERIGRTPAYVAQRLKLTELAPLVRERLAKDAVTLGVALLIARIPDRKLQEAALKDVASDGYRKPMSAPEAAKHIAERFMLQLAKAPFDRADPRLVPGAGACTTCKKRTGNQAELFADVKSPDLCTDPPCFRSKLDAHWLVAKAAAKENKIPTVEGKAFEKEVGDWKGTLRRLDDIEWTGKRDATIRSMLGKKVESLPITLGHDPKSGQIVELAPRAAIDKALGKPRMGGLRSDTGESKARKKAQLERKVGTIALNRAIEAALEKLPKLDRTATVNLLLRVWALTCGFTANEAIAVRRGMIKSAKKESATDALEDVVPKMTANEVLGLCLEVAIHHTAPSLHNGVGDDRLWPALAKHCGIDLPKLQAQAKAELAPKDEKKPKPSTKKPKAPKRTVKK